MASTLSLFLKRNEEGNWEQIKTYVPVIEGSWSTPEEAAAAIIEQAPSIFLDARNKGIAYMDTNHSEYAIVHVPVEEQGASLFHSFDLIATERKVQLIQLAKRNNGVPTINSEMIPPPKPCEMQFYQKILTPQGMHEESVKLWGEKQINDNGSKTGG